MLSLFLSLGTSYQMITPEQWNEWWSSVFTLFNDKIFGRSACVLQNERIVQKCDPCGWNSRTDWYQSIPSDQPLNQQSDRFTIVKCFHSDLADFVRLSYPSGKRWKSHNCSSYVLDFSEHILDFCCLEISTFQLGKVWTKSPMAEWLLKFYWTP